ncbi:cysteine peptidase family C39 domain-containing protein [Spirochaeta dissipatitropha]
MKLTTQFDGSDCGPACIAMIANHFGRQVSMTQMLERAGTDRNSTNLKGLIQAAATVDLNAQAVKGEAGSLTPEVPVPCIAHVTKEQQYHFVVVYKISKDTVWVADPDPTVGKTTYTHEEFYQIWTGYLVLLSRGENFRRKV